MSVEVVGVVRDQLCGVISGERDKPSSDAGLRAERLKGRRRRAAKSATEAYSVNQKPAQDVGTVRASISIVSEPEMEHVPKSWLSDVAATNPV
jgi:hypothetical protein